MKDDAVYFRSSFLPLYWKPLRTAYILAIPIGVIVLFLTAIYFDIGFLNHGSLVAGVHAAGICGLAILSLISTSILIWLFPIKLTPAGVSAATCWGKFYFLCWDDIQSAKLWILPFVGLEYVRITSDRYKKPLYIGWEIRGKKKFMELVKQHSPPGNPLQKFFDEQGGNAGLDMHMETGRRWCHVRIYRWADSVAGLLLIAAVALIAGKSVQHHRAGISHAAPITSIGRLNVGRFGMPAVVVKDEIFVLGGYGNIPGASGDLDDMERFDPRTGRVYRVKAGLIRRGFHTAESYEGRIYILGGVASPSISRFWRDEFTIYPRGVEIFDPATGAIRMGARMPTGRWLAAAVVFDGNIYVIGGSPPRWGKHAPDSTVLIYDIAADTWRKGASMPTRRQCEAVLHRGLIYAIGGYDGRGSIANFEVYDPRSDTWSILPDLPFPMSAHHCEVDGDKMYCFGDYTEMGRVCRYDFAEGTWSKLRTPCAAARHNAVAAVGDTVYVIGGSAGAEGSDRIQSFSLESLRAASPATAGGRP